VIMYADTITESMQRTIDETNRRREKQLRYNEEHHITPTPIVKNGISSLAPQKQPQPVDYYVEPEVASLAADPVVKSMTPQALEKAIEHTRRLMEKAAKDLNFIEAAQYRDELLKLEKQLLGK
jgi:excinuclease ABC subunit B